ncbi:hypothetical protein WT97_10820 [Burkholderia sp. MSMB1459WGS]|nr:hypothetical protein WT24_02525 [Burkholderia sp. MSMB1078WGS]KWO45613.1 hypothetical protein WT97_10820 [Burkholderia sp. MSMB1459WGS]
MRCRVLWWLVRALVKYLSMPQFVVTEADMLVCWIRVLARPMPASWLAMRRKVSRISATSLLGLRAPMLHVLHGATATTEQRPRSNFKRLVKQLRH